jgi:pimeloyl-ACP methyl ester carboxylesterase
LAHPMNVIDAFAENEAAGMTMLRICVLLLSAVMVSILSSAAEAKPIHEEMFVPIGGIEQWITIHGNDSAKPVVLVLHGGPGDALSPYGDSLFAGWDKDFTMVEWDQRGAGRTYGKSGPSIDPTMTMGRMSQDGIEVAQYLIHHLSKSRIILIGGSWGSVLGIHMVHDRPDLFYAFVGQSVVVNFKKAVAGSYERVMQMAEAANDQTTVTALKSIGAPPWKSLFPQWRIYRKAEQAYQAKLVTAPIPPMHADAVYASAAERKQYSEAEDFSMFHFWAGRQPKSDADVVNLTLSGPLAESDLPALGTRFKIPIYFVEGDNDLTAPPELAKTYFESISAPRKDLYMVPGNGHEPSQAMIDLTRKVLLEKIEPLAKAS